MSKKNSIFGLPQIAPQDTAAQEPQVVVLEVEKPNYQIDQEQVVITEELPVCPRCGSAERTPLNEIMRHHTDNGMIIRYRTRCRGLIQPLDEDGKLVVDDKGKPKTYLCNNRYRIRKIIVKKQSSDDR
ncbi:hypothetical protein FACS189443_5770 [Planctomycetales bacterium]|nr:hypothetical protein FACS189443_5770 [Planctomycetales bacterium]